MCPIPSSSIFSRFKGKTKFNLKPYEYNPNNPYQIERIHISPKNQNVTRYVNGFLLRIIKSDRHLSIYRPMISASRMLRIGVCIRRYYDEIKTNDPNTFESYEFEHHDECSRWRRFYNCDSVHIPMYWPDEFCYATVDIMIMKIDNIDNKATILEGIGEKKNGFAYLDVNGGSIRVYKEILSNQIDYFNKLFNGKKKMRYKLDVDIEDMIEIIYCLSPFNRPIRSGLTYGALYRLSDKFKCLKLADMADNYIYRIKRYAPYLFSYIALEGHVKEEMLLYSELQILLQYDPKFVADVEKEREARRIERDEWLATGKEYYQERSYEHRSIREL